MQRSGAVVELLDEKSKANNSRDFVLLSTVLKVPSGQIRFA
jgi:hypothetical protein